MNTSKPFSTISYNTDSFLQDKLNFLLLNGDIDFACYISHRAEEDEEKDHKHLIIFPSQRVSTNQFLKLFDEKCADNELPLKCLPARSSKFDDWYLYELHDRAYLASKMMTRKYHYGHEDFWSTDKDFLRHLSLSIDRSKYIGLERLINAAKESKPFCELVALGNVPVQLVKQYEYVYEMIKKSDVTYRGDRRTHTPKAKVVDVNTLGDDIVVNEDGEILECPFEK